MRVTFRLIMGGLLIIVLAYSVLSWAREDAPNAAPLAAAADPIVEVVFAPTATPYGLGVVASDLFYEMDCSRVFPRHDGAQVGYIHDGPQGMASAKEIELWQAFSKSERVQLFDWCVERTATWANRSN